jgi:CheY-like chemotaxis protein
LFADDELHFIEALIEVAIAEGCEVLTCRDASEAIKLVANRSVDCLVIDVMMHRARNFQTATPKEVVLWRSMKS